MIKDQVKPFEPAIAPPREIGLSENSRQVLKRRYLRRGLDGKPVEDIEGMFRRVAQAVAGPDAAHGYDEKSTEDSFYALLSTLRFFPNSPTFTGAGTPLGQLAACFTAGMRVTTEHGVTPIVELRPGDRVLTHEGRYRPVTEVFQRAYQGELLRIKIKLIGTSLEVTPEHPILTPTGWVKAGQLKVGDQVAVGAHVGERPAPMFDLAQLVYSNELEMQAEAESIRVRRPSTYQNSGRQANWQHRFVELTPDLARLCGYYVSEGTIGPDERYIRFTFGTSEEEYAADVVNLMGQLFGVPVNRSASNFGNWQNLNFYSRAATAWFAQNFGRYSYGKTIPVWLQYAARETQEAFLVGLMRGDGLYYEKLQVVKGRHTPKLFRSLRLTLSNPGLIQQIWQMCLRLGYDAAVRPVDTTYVTENARDTAQVSLPPLQSRRLVEAAFGKALPEPDFRYVRNTVHRDGDQVYFEVESVESDAFTGTVYNCEVDEDHSYVTEGIIVHNCFVLPISDDMGRSSDGIFQTLRDAALIQQTGGGNGFSFSNLRPKGDAVASSAGVATGPVGFLKVYDIAFGEVAQGGCLAPETLVFTSKGLLRLDEIARAEQSGWQEHTLQVASNDGWRASPRSFNNGVAHVMRVHTKQGLSLSGTPNHRVQIMSNEGPVWRRIDELEPGNWIMVRLGQHRGQLQALRQPKQHHGNQDMATLPSILDEELAFFLGYMTGDGFMASGDDDYRVGVSVSHNSYLMEEMPRLLQRLFGVTIHVQQKPEDASVTLVVYNRSVKEFLTLNGFTKARSRDASVPRLIRQSPPNIVGAFLRGLFEADGTLVHGFPSLSSSSKRLIEETSTLLIGLGCPITIRSVSPGINHYGSATVYHLTIRSTVGLNTWREKIGCDRRSRLSPAYVWEGDQQRESSYVIPNPAYWLEPLLAEITLPQIDKKGRGMGRKMRSTEPKLRRSLLRYLRHDRQFTRSAYEALTQHSPELAMKARNLADWWFVEVAGVETAGESLTLDLEVDETHAYLAYGMVTHNTRRGANMAVLRVDHPDIEEFITCKAQEGQISNFNVSVGITDEFMRAVESDSDFELRNPRDGKVWRTVKARELFHKVVTYAHHNGEPGALFLDAANRQNPVPHLYKLEATNPCFVGSTRVATDQGFLTMAELNQLGKPLRVVTDERAAPEWVKTRTQQASPVVMTRRNTPVVTLTTVHGYEVTATPDHRFLTPNRGYVALADLRPGDKVLLQAAEGLWSQNYLLPNREHVAARMAVMARGGDHASGNTVTRHDFSDLYAGMPTLWSHDLGVALGRLVGDGWLSPSSNSPVGFAFGIEDGGYCGISTLQPILQKWFGPGHTHERGNVRQLTYGRLPYEFFASLGVKSVPATEKRVPDSIWRAPREAVIGFLGGLFSANGSVQINEEKQDCTVRLASSSRGLLQETQLLLSNFGIVSRIYRRRGPAARPMPDGKGGMRAYQSAPQYELVIGKSNRNRFAELIGFAHPQKQARLEQHLATMAKGAYRERFEDRVVSVEDAGVADVYDLTEEATNSFIAHSFVVHNCGEQWLGPYENCCLGSINLAQHITDDGQVDWEKLRVSAVVSTRFLDNVVDANKYVPAVPQLREAALRARRIGLGIMGLGDMMYRLRVRYGSEEGQEFAAQVMEFVRYHCMLTSIELSKERGPFLAIKDSIYDPDNLQWQPPQALQPYTRDWGRPGVDWNKVVAGIKQHGIRNAAQTTVAPTGTIGTVAGCEGYGCEPVFALAYTRNVKDGEKDLKLTYTSPLFEQALTEVGISKETQARISEEVTLLGTCQTIQDVPEPIRRVFVVSSDITAEEHVRMQAAIQAFVDNSISKTVNFPASATVEDVEQAYMLGWKMGCKGLTVYVTGSREEVVLETKATAEAKGRKTGAELAIAPAPVTPLGSVEAFPQLKRRPRPSALRGITYRKETPLGTAYVTVNINGGDKPFEVFMNVGKAGSDVASVSEALGRLISLILRLPSTLDEHVRLEEVVDQLAGIGGGRSLGFGANRVRSLPDAVAQVLREYLGQATGAEDEAANDQPEYVAQLPLPITDRPIGDLCPDCGQATFVPTEGCRKCYACGYSEC